jgi:hypothetical protein
LTWFVIPKLSRRVVFKCFEVVENAKKGFNKVGEHLNCIYGGVAGGAGVMSALVYRLNKVDHRIIEANNSDLKAGKNSE